MEYTTIQAIQSGEITNEELLECLRSKNIFVLSNAMRELVNRQLKTDNVYHEIGKLTDFLSKEHRLMGLYTVGHLAIATLLKLEYEKEDIKAYQLMDQSNQTMVMELVSAYHEVLI